MVSCSKRNGEWSEPKKILTMRIPRPWYTSWWFIIATLALITGVCFLITYSFRQRKEHQKQLTQKQQEQFIYEDKLGLLINISHELRTPLTLVMAPLKRLLSRMTPSDDNFSTLSRIYRQSRRMKDLLNMVLELRKMELGESQLKIEGVNLNVWILDTIEDFINEEHEEGISVKTELDPDAPLVDLDRQKCETILTNLLINAIKHSKAGQTITLCTEYIENEDIVKISVKDEGPGIKDLDPAKLFTRFYKNGKYSNGKKGLL
jgi:signal transduction histidine kinase